MQYKQTVLLTRDEIVLLLRAISIATEDGSIYGDPDNEAADNAMIEAVQAKLRIAAKQREIKRSRTFKRQFDLHVLHRDASTLAQSMGGTGEVFYNSKLGGWHGDTKEGPIFIRPGS